jgi:hypothetical protein
LQAANKQFALPVFRFKSSAQKIFRLVPAVKLSSTKNIFQTPAPVTALCFFINAFDRLPKNNFTCFKVIFSSAAIHDAQFALLVFCFKSLVLQHSDNLQPCSYQPSKPLLNASACYSSELSKQNSLHSFSLSQSHVQDMNCHASFDGNMIISFRTFKLPKLKQACS